MPELNVNAPLFEEKKEGSSWKIVPTVKDVDSDLRTGKLIRNRVEDTKAAVAFVSDKLKSSSSILRFGLETFESIATPFVKPIVETVDGSVVQRLDPLISYAYNTSLKVGGEVFKVVDVNGDGSISLGEAASAPVNLFKGLVVDSEWFDKVDEILNPSNITPELLVSRFNEAAVAEFKRITESAQEAKRTIDSYTSQEFIDGLSKQIGEAWDEKLVNPATEFLKAAQAECNRVDTNNDGIVSVSEILAALEPVWNEKVVKVFQARIRPAVVAYKSIMDAYTTYRKVAEEKGYQVSAEHFLNEMKDRLDEAYDERLAPFINQVYEGAGKLITEDLERIVAALDMDDDNKLTISDFLLMGNALVKKFVESPYQTVLRTTMQAVEYIAPEKKEDEFADSKAIVDDLTLSLVTKSISKRLVRKAVTGFSDLKLRAEALVGPDLINYADSLVKGVHDNRVAPAVLVLKERVENFKSFVTENVKPMKTAAVEFMQSPRALELKKRFALAVDRAQTIAANGAGYVLKRELLLLPIDMAEFFAMTVGIKKKDEEFEVLVDTVQGLLTAIFNVVSIVSWKEEKEIEAKEEAEDEAESKAKAIAEES